MRMSGRDRRWSFVVSRSLFLEDRICPRRIPFWSWEIRYQVALHFGTLRVGGTLLDFAQQSRFAQ